VATDGALGNRRPRIAARAIAAFACLLGVRLNDLDVTRDRWWGYLLHVVVDNVRFPFTAVGFRYDLNHGRWYGPDSGNSGN
jgi:hypothetical protein